jgi:hypothetical protein
MFTEVGQKCIAHISSFIWCYSPNTVWAYHLLREDLYKFPQLFFYGFEFF